MVSVIFQTIRGGLHLLKGGMNINRRCADVRVFEHTAESLNIAAALQNICCVCMPKLVGRYVPFYVPSTKIDFRASAVSILDNQISTMI